MHTFEQEFKIFEREALTVFQIFHTNRAFEKSLDDREVWEAFNQTAAFWNDYRYMSNLSIITVLGRIFDSTNPENSHSIYSLLKKIKETDYLSLKSLRARRLREFATEEELDSYLSTKIEFSVRDIVAIEAYIGKIVKLWEPIRPIRDKFMAHTERINEVKKTNLLKLAKYKTLEDIVGMLIRLRNAIRDVMQNGNGISFDGMINEKKGQYEDFDKLAKSLVNGLK